jgi:taurine transport system substrate-binding protein
VYRTHFPFQQMRAIGETAKVLKEQGKVERVLPDYSPYVSAKFVQE